MVTQLYEKKAIKHEKSGNPDKDHLCWYIHQENNCNLLMLHVNVGILKKKAKVYYQHIQEFAHCLSELKNKKD